jgi:hypothetical protein
MSRKDLRPGKGWLTRASSSNYIGGGSFFRRRRFGHFFGGAFGSGGGIGGNIGDVGRCVGRGLSALVMRPLINATAEAVAAADRRQGECRAIARVLVRA